MTLSFPSGEAWNSSREVVQFLAVVNGKNVSCAISWEALQDNFGGKSARPLDCFRSNRKSIETKAESIIQKSRFESDGSILIRSQDGP